MTGLHAALAALAAEHRVGTNPAPYTSERALIERIEALLDDHPAPADEAPTPLSGNESHPDGRCPEHGIRCTGPTCCCRDKHRGADLPVATAEIADQMVDDECARPDLPVATDSTTAAFCASRNPEPPHQRCEQGAGHDGRHRDFPTDPAKAETYWTDPPAPEPSDRAGLSEIRARIERYRREWLWQEADEEHVARWGFHIGQMLHRLPKDGQTTDMQASIEAMIADLGILADRLAVAEQEQAEARERHAAAVQHGVVVGEAWEKALERAEAAEQKRDEAQQAEAVANAAWDREVAWKAEAEQETATLRAQVAAVEALAEEDDERWKSFAPEDRPSGYLARGVRAALGDPAQVVQRIKDEAAATALEDAAEQCERDAEDGHCGSSTCAESNRVTAAWLRERARRVRDGGDHG